MKAIKRFGLAAAGLLVTMALVLPGASASAGTPSSSERYVGRIDTLHIFSAETQLVMYGPYQVGALGAWFNQERMPSYIPQQVVPYVQIPDAAPHTYRFQCDVDTRGPAGTETEYRLIHQGVVTTLRLPQGPRTVNYELAVDLDTDGGWTYWALDNTSGHIWGFLRCEVYEQLN
jgi:hypothetical protein